MLTVGYWPWGLGIAEPIELRALPPLWTSYCSERTQLRFSKLTCCRHKISSALICA